MSTIHTPRDYQLRLESDVYDAWRDGARNVLAVLPTGGGKTFVFSRIASAMNTAVAAVAHRKELVGQMSLALAREGVRHDVVGPDSVRRQCVSIHMDVLGRSYYDGNARVAVCGVDTLINISPSDPWLPQVGLWIMDEAHHVLASNKWGKACELFPNARGLGVTATPLRADGKGLGRHADGLFDAMVLGPSMRELIDRNYLTEYRVFAPPNDLDLSQVTTTDSGEYSPPKLKAARRASTITGDVVKHYLRIARGKLGVTFDTDIESATDTAEAYRREGVPAEVVHAKTPDALRTRILARFRNREILQLVNVDLFGEGFDLPAIEVVSMARATQSYGLYVQQFGRALRIMDGKTHALIIDHVGNVHRHGLPDARRAWTLDRRERGARNRPTDVVPVKTCLNETCMAVYERVYAACPFCGFESPITNRSAPEYVDGDLCELDPAVLARLRGESDRIMGAPTVPFGAEKPIQMAVRNMHATRRDAHAELFNLIALYGGWQRALGRPESESYRRFFYAYGIDVATAQTLPAKDAEQLTHRIRDDLNRHGVTALTT